MGSRPDGGYVAGYVAPTMSAARGVWSLRDSFQALRQSSWPQPDPLFSSVKVLAHFDGTNNSTTFTDSSSYARTLTRGGVAVISTTRSRWGGSSLSCPGGSDNVTAAASADLALGSADFCIEGWVWFNASTGGTFFTLKPSGGFGLEVTLAGGSVNAYASTNGTSYNLFVGIALSGANSGQWNHVAIVRSGTSIAGFFNGTRTSLATTSAAIAGTTPILTIGAGGVYVDDFRFTSGSGTSRYSGSTITLPNGAFPDR